MKAIPKAALAQHVIALGKTRSGKRFMSKVERLNNGCWRWLGKIQPNGYGAFAISHSTHVYAHRWIYTHVRGLIPAGLDLDHLCRNRWCVNPHHLEAVSRRENLLRGRTIPAWHVSKTHCPAGHAYNAENTYAYRGMRQCKECRRQRNREYQARQRGHVALTRHVMPE